MAKLSASELAAPESRRAGATARKLVLVGFMGAGKSRAARNAVATLGGEAADTDALLEAQLGEPIASYFEREGESAFRDREEALVVELLERPGPSVIALGGGAVKSERVRELLSEHVPVYLEVESQVAWERCRDSGRPLARDSESFHRLHAERVPLYESVARVTLAGGEGAVTAAGLVAAARLTAPAVPRSLRMVWAKTVAGGYPVYVGEGALDCAGALLPVGGRSFLVADERAHEFHGKRLTDAFSSETELPVLVVPPGERSKTLAEAERLVRDLARAGMERSDRLLALGGGVVGDLVGFCAGVYQRGVAVVHVPTTLVAQVDSAYGGKTGVDLPEAKNYVGVFHQPTAVLTDPTALTTLPVPELRAGFAEMVKTGLIAGEPLWHEIRALDTIDAGLERDPASVRRAIEGCLRVKLAVVARDELDQGVRASLNLGHTFAHALEAATGYSAYRHGEAVALGLLVALRLSEQEVGLDPALEKEVAELLRRHGLPTSFSGPSTPQLLAHASRDKKRRGGQPNFVLLRAAGDVVLDCDVSEQAVADAIDASRSNEAGTL